MEIWIFGNPDQPSDSIPVSLMKELQQIHPHHKFIHADPLDEREPPQHLMIIDTVQGISDITKFETLDRFQQSPRTTLHDFDAYANLRLLQKVGKLKTCSVIGVPSGFPKEEVVKKISAILS